MEGTIERESGALGGLFQQIIQDMKNGMPLWEDLITKATKLHSSLKATILAVTAYLDAFQKIADSATNARGATRDIGTALTRICLRHKAVEARMKNFTSVIMECLIMPLQDKLEEWKKTVVNLDKDHAKDYKRARAELKKRSSDTLRLQKKMRKGAGGDVQKRFECGLQDVTERRQLLEETEKHAVRAALIEERGRFCSFVGLLKPVVDEEVAMLTEMGHLQEAVQQLEKHTSDPQTLPPASEQVIADLKSSDGGWMFRTPPSSPSSLGSRKSSMCSISSINSSSSSSSKSHHSPSHPWQRSLSQPVGRSGTMRVRSVSSQDSGFTSQDTLYPRPPSSFSVAQVSNMSEHSQISSSSSTPCTPFPTSTTAPTTTSTWPNLQETIQFERAASAIISDRPHTISSAYEKGHQRPPLTVYTFQAPDQQSLSQPASPVTSSTLTDTSCTVSPKSPAASIKSASKPPLPTRCSSLERQSGPSIPAKTIAGMQGVRVLPPGAEISLAKRPIAQASNNNIIATVDTCPAASDSEVLQQQSQQPQQPTYVNMHELASMAATKAQQQKDKSLPPPPADFISPPEKATEGEKESSTSESSLESSSGYGSQTTFTAEEAQHLDDINGTTSKYCTLPRNNELLNAVRRRPLSMTAMGSHTMRNTLLRRGSMQTQKPPPPIRRTSSITNTACSMGSLEHLPPPPAFLLEPTSPIPSKTQTPGVNVAETVKALTELKHTPASPNSIRRMSSSTQNIYQNTQSSATAPMAVPQQQQQHHNSMIMQSSSPVLSTFQSQQTATTKLSYVSQSGGVVYARPSQIMMSGSPNAVRRINNFRSQSADRKSEGPGGVGSNFIATLSAKLAPQLSPRSSRRRVEDEQQKIGVGGGGGGYATSGVATGRAAGAAQQQQHHHHHLQKHQQQRSGPGQTFLDSLNAKLAAQQQQQQPPQQQQQAPQMKANRIRQIINSKAQPDPKVCHESLMDQIKRGATLKRAKATNDRSAPKIY